MSKALAKKKPRKIGRNLKLTSKVQARICQAIREGKTQERAANLAGIDHSTFYRWLVAGEAAGEGDPRRDFRQAVLQAQEDFIDRQLAELEKDADTENSKTGIREWRAREALLRLRFPKKFNPKQVVEVNANLTPRPPIDPKNLTPEELATLEALLTKGAPGALPVGGAPLALPSGEEPT